MTRILGRFAKAGKRRIEKKAIERLRKFMDKTVTDKGRPNQANNQNLPTS
jgi:hypothetical protein